MRAAAERGEVVLGGCDEPLGASPSAGCVDCRWQGDPPSRPPIAAFDRDALRTWIESSIEDLAHLSLTPDEQSDSEGQVFTRWSNASAMATEVIFDLQGAQVSVTVTPGSSVVGRRAVEWDLLTTPVVDIEADVDGEWLCDLRAVASVPVSTLDQPVPLALLHGIANRQANLLARAILPDLDDAFLDALAPDAAESEIPREHIGDDSSDDDNRRTRQLVRELSRWWGPAVPTDGLSSDVVASFADTWAHARLAYPFVPSAVAPGVRLESAWNWVSERSPDSTRHAYLQFPLLERFREGDWRTRFQVCHSGHGVNSYFLSYAIVGDRLVVFAQESWGGIYSDADDDATRVNDLAGDLALLAHVCDSVRDWPGGRLVVESSPERERNSVYWLATPGAAPRLADSFEQPELASLTGWLPAVVAWPAVERALMAVQELWRDERRRDAWAKSPS